jgi:hypothetical protein
MTPRQGSLHLQRRSQDFSGEGIRSDLVSYERNCVVSELYVQQFEVSEILDDDPTDSHYSFT